MIEKIRKFFEENVEATEVHVALGYLFETPEEALNCLKGVSDQVVKTYTREQLESLSKEAEEPLDVSEHPLVKQFKKLPAEKMPAFIERQTEVVEKLKAQEKATDDQEKHQKALKFHSSILEARKLALAEKSQEKGQ